MWGFRNICNRRPCFLVETSDVNVAFYCTHAIDYTGRLLTGQYSRMYVMNVQSLLVAFRNIAYVNTYISDFQVSADSTKLVLGSGDICLHCFIRRVLRKLWLNTFLCVFMPHSVYNLIDCKWRRNAEARLCPRVETWSIKVDATNHLSSRVQPVEFLRTKVDDECCRWDKTLSWWHQYCAIVSWQVWSLDLSVAVRTVAPEQVPSSGMQFSAMQLIRDRRPLVTSLMLLYFLICIFFSCAKWPYFHFRSKIWRHHRVARPRFPPKRGNLGNSVTSKGFIAYFSLRMREMAVFPLPV